LAAEEVYIDPGIADHPLDEPGELTRPLTDEELLALEYGPWLPEPEPFEDLSTLAFRREELPSIAPQILPSEFTEFAFRVPREDNQGWENFSFAKRRHLIQPYDTPARRVLLFCARQVEKSTMLGNKALGYSCLIPGYKILYVSPSATQTKTFSNDRVKEPIDISPVLRAFTTHMLSQNIFEKQFVNRSKVTLRYAFLNADRTRGIPADGLFVDEIQDILSDNLPVIEQCTSHSTELLKRFIYSGTPKTLDNIIEEIRAKRSTQGEWVVPCEAHGGETGRYWNILGEKNIGKKGIICEKCGKAIHAQHPDAQWAFMVDDADFESFRIPQLMVPWLDWDELLYNHQYYPRAKFYNECLGISFDTGLRPLTIAQVRACCNEDVFMADLDKYVNIGYGQDVFAGIDWGTAENSFTVLSLGTYISNKFRIFYVKRYTGAEAEPEPMLEDIVSTCKLFNVRLIGADYGGGHYPNSTLARNFGISRVQKYQYAGRLNAKLKWEPKLVRWMAHRTEVMSALFNAIKKGNVIEFPRWREFYEPYGQDMLNIYSHYNERLHMTQYDKTPGKTDDTFHSVLYCLFASMIVHPRPDILTPHLEQGHTGTVYGGYSGPTYQG
jgi:hypothetical protein